MVSVKQKRYRFGSVWLFLQYLLEISNRTILYWIESMSLVYWDLILFLNHVCHSFAYVALVASESRVGRLLNVSGTRISNRHPNPISHYKLMGSFTFLVRVSELNEPCFQNKTSIRAHFLPPTYRSCLHLSPQFTYSAQSSYDDSATTVVGGGDAEVNSSCVTSTTYCLRHVHVKS